MKFGKRKSREGLWFSPDAPFTATKLSQVFEIFRFTCAPLRQPYSAHWLNSVKLFPFQDALQPGAEQDFQISKAVDRYVPDYKSSYSLRLGISCPLALPVLAQAA